MVMVIDSFICNIIIFYENIAIEHLNYLNFSSQSSRLLKLLLGSAPDAGLLMVTC